MFQRALCLVGGFALAAFSLAPPAAAQEIPELSAHLSQLRARNPVRSFSVAATRQGELVHAQADGQRDVGRAATTNTSFAIASVSKHVTAALVLKLTEEGKLSLTDRLADKLPALPVSGQVTLERLLTHTSGLPEMLNFRNQLALDWSTPIATEAWLDRIAMLPAASGSPVGRYLYCNTGYVLLGAVVEKVHGSTLADAYQELVFSPAGVSGITFGPPNNDDVASGFRNGFPVPAMHASRAGGAGGLYASPTALLRWTWAIRTNKVLQESSTKAMFSPQVAGGVLPGDYYGFGWMISKKGTLYHGGKVDGFTSVLALFPSYLNEIHVAFLTNEENTVGLDQLALETRLAVLKVENESITEVIEEILDEIGRNTFDHNRMATQLRAEFSTPAIQRQLDSAKALGAPTDVAFVTANPGPATAVVLYDYRATYARGKLLWRIGFDLEGKIVSIWFQPSP